MIRAEKAPRKPRAAKTQTAEVVTLPVAQRAAAEEEISFTRKPEPADIEEARRKLGALRGPAAAPAPTTAPQPTAEAPRAFAGKQPKAHVSLRLDVDVLEAYKAAGKGWQSLIGDVLRKNMPR